MRILFLMQCLGVGGAERHIFTLAQGLTRRGHTVSLAALHVLDPDWKWLLPPDAFPVEVLFSNEPTNPFSAAIQLILAVIKVRRRVKSDSVQILYSTQWNISNMIAWLAARGLPKITLVWGALGMMSGAGRRRIGWKMRIASLCSRWVSPTVPLLIGNSDAVVAHSLSGGKRCQKNTVILNGIDVDLFQPDPRARHQVRSEWAIPENVKLIGLIGRLDPVKGHPVFLEAAARLARERQDVSFICLGEGPQHYRDQLIQTGRDLGLEDRLLWVRTRDDISPVYNALDILCSASYGEGFAYVIGEAMACGVPCVVTDVGHSAKAVGDLGVVVPPGDAEKLADGLRSMLQKLDKVQPDLLRQRIVDEFSIERMVETTETVLMEIMSEGS